MVRVFFLLSCCKAFTGNCFPVVRISPPPCRLAHLYQVEDMYGILVFYWLYIILDATAYALKLQLHSHPCFLLVLFCSCCNSYAHGFPRSIGKKAYMISSNKNFKTFQLENQLTRLANFCRNDSS